VCVKLNKYQEAEKVLLGKLKGLREQRITFEERVANVPNGAAGLYLLGFVCEQQGKRDTKQYYLRCLEMDPTMWVAYERLVKLKVDLDPTKVFNDKNPSIREMNTRIKEALMAKANPGQSPKAFLKSPGPFSNPKTPIQQFHES
jgi:hypothetical protein